MNRTYGKTRARKPARHINIINIDGHVVAEKRCSTQRQALMEFFLEQLKSQGYADPIVIGNVLSVSMHRLGHRYLASYTAVYPPVRL